MLLAIKMTKDKEQGHHHRHVSRHRDARTVHLSGPSLGPRSDRQLTMRPTRSDKVSRCQYRHVWSAEVQSPVGIMPPTNRTTQLDLDPWVKDLTSRHAVVTRRRTVLHRLHRQRRSPIGQNSSIVVMLRQMLPGVTYERWLTMTILEHLGEIGTQYDVSRFIPLRWR
jgi:hypothetical protein